MQILYRVGTTILTGIAKYTLHNISTNTFKNERTRRYFMKKAPIHETQIRCIVKKKHLDGD